MRSQLPSETKLELRVKRARTQKGTGVYQLGKGGFDPKASRPLDSRGRCDCSGFVAWVFGMTRHQAIARKPWSKWFPWFETTAIWRSLDRGDSPFCRIDGPLPGCMVVVPDKFGQQGHVGIVTSVVAQDVYHVVDCSPSNPAIRERLRPSVFARDDVRFAVLREDMAPERA